MGLVVGTLFTAEDNHPQKRNGQNGADGTNHGRVHLNISLKEFSRVKAPTLNGYLSIGGSPPELHVVHHRDQLANDLHHDGSNGHDKKGGQDAKEDREDKLNAQFGRLFLGDLAGLYAHVIGVRAQ